MPPKQQHQATLPKLASSSPNRKPKNPHLTRQGGVDNSRDSSTSSAKLPKVNQAKDKGVEGNFSQKEDLLKAGAEKEVATAAAEKKAAEELEAKVAAEKAAAAAETGIQP